MRDSQEQCDKCAEDIKNMYRIRALELVKDPKVVEAFRTIKECGMSVVDFIHMSGNLEELIVGGWEFFYDVPYPSRPCETMRESVKQLSELIDLSDDTQVSNRFELFGLPSGDPTLFHYHDLVNFALHMLDKHAVFFLRHEKKALDEVLGVSIKDWRVPSGS